MVELEPGGNVARLQDEGLRSDVPGRGRGDESRRTNERQCREAHDHSMIGPRASLKRGTAAADSAAVARNEDGFTLIELLVVLILIAILIAVAVGFQMQARERASDATAKTNLRVATPAFEAYHTDNDSSYMGMTLAGLQASYSPGIVGIEVVSVSENDYCVRAVVGASAWYKQGPNGELTKTVCS